MMWAQPPTEEAEKEWEYKEREAAVARKIETARQAVKKEEKEYIEAQHCTHIGMRPKYAISATSLHISDSFCLEFLHIKWTARENITYTDGIHGWASSVQDNIKHCLESRETTQHIPWRALWPSCAVPRAPSLPTFHPRLQRNATPQYEEVQLARHEIVTRCNQVVKSHVISTILFHLAAGNTGNQLVPVLIVQLPSKDALRLSVRNQLVLAQNSQGKQ